MSCNRRWTIQEETSARILIQLLDHQGRPIDVSGINSVTATLYDVASAAVINGRDEQNVMGASGGELLVPPAIVDVLATTPVRIVTGGEHQLQRGMLARIDGVVGPTAINGRHYPVQPIRDDQFVLSGTYGAGYPEYVSGGTLVTGLFALDLTPDDNVVLDQSIPIDGVEEHRLVIEVDFGQGTVAPSVWLDLVRRR